MKITIEATPLEVSEVICALVNYGANTVGDTDGDTEDDTKIIIGDIIVMPSKYDPSRNSLHNMFKGINKTTP